MRRLLLVTVAAMLCTAPAHAQRSCSDFTIGANQQIAACTSLITGFNDSDSARVRLPPADRNRYNLFINRGAAFARNGDAERSKADFRRAVEMATEALEEGGNPLPGEYNRRCWARAVANVELDLALADCNEAVRLVPRSPAFLDSRAFVHLRSGRNEDAIKDYDTALRLNPRLPDSLYGRGLAKLRLGDAEGAKADLFLAESLRPGTRVQFMAFGITD
jgi:tetratricopeptide (TPR) repeat protein